ncbi:MAG: Na(+)-translocating NADH-quinone reductase subunit A [Gammaproteobacteria bacterium]|nr:Na(+)-translocating NADH-quinone reductase subunit A [Gammaproteobacteria bacterium]MDH3767760.1 Na(+)-translocating NADH-quinone reductase subunit A [Gammaproteobacteria bacterium]
MRKLQFRLKTGLDVPISGTPVATIDTGAAVGSVALLGPDYLGLRPQLRVTEGDRVRLGQVLVEDKANPAARLTAPGSGTITAIRRGARRVLQTIKIELAGDDEERFASYPSQRFSELERDKVVDNLVASGLWTAIRARPFSRVATPEQSPQSIFVAAMDTNPLAADPVPIIDTDPEAFADGLLIVSRLTNGPLFVCCAHNSTIPTPASEQIRVATFTGPHPAGLVGTHIHLLDAVGEQKTVWHVGYQDVMAIGRLFRHGRLDVSRIIALGGPLIHKPRLLRTRLGASLADLIKGEVGEARRRVISGSVLSGRHAAGWAAYLGRYDTQVSVLSEGDKREFLGWLAPGSKLFSATRLYLSSLLRKREFSLNTSTHGSRRAMIPIGSFEQVMPLDILPTPLLKALLVDDRDTARALGALELDEEDLALCSFVCSGKYDYGPHLRRNLDRIEADG